MPKCSKSYYYRCIWCFRGFEFDKNVPRLVTTGAINLKKKQSEGNTLLRYEYLFYPNTQFQMLKSFLNFCISKLLKQFADTKVHCVSRGNILPEFFFSPLYMREFFLGRWSCAGIFFLRIPLQDSFFFKINPPSSLK